MFHIVLYQPEIAPNTGNIIRLCANTGSILHLIEPLGFEPDDKKLKRAGLDYSDWSKVHRYSQLDDFLCNDQINKIYTLSTHHQSLYTTPNYQANDVFIFGPETRGLPLEVRGKVPVDQQITLPMRPNNRSLNLANSVAILLYEAWRQTGFKNSK